MKVWTIAALLGALAACHREPKAQLAFLNNSTRALHPMLVRDGKYAVDMKLAPHSVQYAPVPFGTYDLIVLDEATDATVRQLPELVLSPPVPGARPVNYLEIDLEGQGVDLLVDASFEYEATGAIASQLADIHGTDIVRGRYDAAQPIPLEFNPLPPFAALPTKKGALDSVLTWVPCGDAASDAAVAECVRANLAARPTP